MRGVIMKEKIEKIKEWIKKNKKRTIGIAAAAVLLVGALGIGIAGVNGFGSNAAQPDKTVVSVKDTSEDQKNTDTDKEDTEKAEDKKEAEEEQKAKAQKELEEKKEKAEESASSNTEQTSTKSSESSNSSTSSSNAKSASSNTSSSSSSGSANSGSSSNGSSNSNSSSSGSANSGQSNGGSSSSGSSSSSQSQPVHTHNWEKEYVDTSYNERVEIAVGNQSGLKIEGDPNEYLLNNSNGDTGWHSEWEDHWVEDGYYIEKCSCGATR